MYNNAFGPYPDVKNRDRGRRPLLRVHRPQGSLDSCHGPRRLVSPRCIRRAHTAGRRQRRPARERDGGLGEGAVRISRRFGEWAWAESMALASARSPRLQHDVLPCRDSVLCRKEHETGLHFSAPAWLRLHPGDSLGYLRGIFESDATYHLMGEIITISVVNNFLFTSAVIK